ncbi:hypothetical protein C1H46_031120 [Malus baccata]|uniref:Late embryogenesis abundant protein LEA-2 subgroup domain-containing protein n=1 Tax=Malus baccata TaxID=106549 RepID=A0A540LA25_MALBA|nr:hypothetical protein C1H46_031120 [Malus baccata]
MFGRHGRYCCCIFLGCITYFFIFIAFIIFWLIFLPQEPKFVITDASLTQFNFTSTNNTLNYNLTVNININIRNPSKKVAHRDTYDLNPLLFKGLRPVTALTNEEASNFRNNTVFDITLKIYFKYWTKIAVYKDEKELQMACYLKVPLSSTRKLAENFQSTKCDKADH